MESKGPWFFFPWLMYRGRKPFMLMAMVSWSLKVSVEKLHVGEVLSDLLRSIFDIWPLFTRCLGTFWSLIESLIDLTCYSTWGPQKQRSNTQQPQVEVGSTFLRAMSTSMQHSIVAQFVDPWWFVWFECKIEATPIWKSCSFMYTLQGTTLGKANVFKSAFKKGYIIY